MNLVNVLNYCPDVINAGGGAEAGIPEAIGNLVHLGFMIIQVVVPILLIIWGMMDFMKGLTKSDEDEIKKGQKQFIQRLIAAIICFLVVTVVQLVINVVGSVTNDETTNTVWTCAKDLINGHPSSTK